MRLTCVFLTAVGVLAGGPALAAGTDGLAITMTGDHARPLPGEEQVYRLSLRNRGDRNVHGAWLAVRLPAGWSAGAPARCRPEDDRTVCDLGKLAPGKGRTVTVRARVPARPRFGRAAITAWSGARTPDGDFTGPSTSLTVEVVRSRW